MLHPLWWFALVLLLLNDHWLKAAGILPGWLTGKLSDFAGMVVAPVLIAALLAVRTRLQVAGCFGAVAALFSVLNLWPAAARGWELFGGELGLAWRLWPDPTDLIALPMLWLTWRVLVPVMRETPDLPNIWRRAGELGGVSLGALACIATSMPSPPRPQVAPGKVLAQLWHDHPINVIDAASGRVLAQIDHGAGAASVLHDGVLYSLRHRRIEAIDITTGDVRFEHVAAGDPYHPTVHADGERVYALTVSSGSTGHEHAVAIDARSGNLLWSTTLPSDERRRSTVDSSALGAGLLLVPVGNTVLALDPRSGQRVWSYAAGVELHHLTIARAAAYGATHEGIIHAIDLERGTALWQFDARSQSFGGSTWSDAPTLSVAGGKLLFIRAGHLTAIDAITATVRWRGPEVLDAIIGEDIIVALLPDEEHLMALNVHDGLPRWKVKPEHWLVWAPTLAEREGIVVVQSYLEGMFAYETTSGRLRWQITLDHSMPAQFEVGRPILIDSGKL